MTPQQCRAARTLAQLTQATLAKAAGLGISTVADFELQRREVSTEAVTRIVEARPGVRLK
jgi:transcriptional regulator with XRE-family HTH domain